MNPDPQDLCIALAYVQSQFDGNPEPRFKILSPDTTVGEIVAWYRNTLKQGFTIDIRIMSQVQ